MMIIFILVAYRFYFRCFYRRRFIAKVISDIGQYIGNLLIFHFGMGGITF